MRVVPECAYLIDLGKLVSLFEPIPSLPPLDGGLVQSVRTVKSYTKAVEY